MYITTHLISHQYQHINNLFHRKKFVNLLNKMLLSVVIYLVLYCNDCDFYTKYIKSNIM